MQIMPIEAKLEIEIGGQAPGLSNDVVLYEVNRVTGVGTIHGVWLGPLHSSFVESTIMHQ